jgi:hypothetical protein
MWGPATVRSRPSPFRGAVLAALISGAPLLAGCVDGDPVGPPQEEFRTLTVPAEQGWAYVVLGETASVVPVASPGTSASWDLAFFATGVMLNGGAAGPGGVEGYCLCQNASLTEAQVKALTAAGEVGAFRSVAAAQLPAGAEAWKSEALLPAVSGWFSYNPVSHTVGAAAGRSWVFRAADGTVHGKLRVARIEGAGRTNAGRVTLEYALQPQRGAAMGEVRSLEVDVPADQKVYVSLTGGAVSTATEWDLMLEGFDIRLNGGSSGSGKAGAVLANQPFEAIATADDVPPAVFKADAFGGVFDAHRWYFYDMTTHQVWPTYNVYLVRKGADVYKVQIIGYYNTQGKDRHITIRYARVRG